MGGPAVIEGKLYPELDNFNRCPFVYDGLSYESAEHMYQALKFQDPVYREAISREKDPQRYYRMGQSRDHVLVPNFEQVKGTLMYLAQRTKMQNYPDLGAKLVATRGRIVFHQSSPFWNAQNAANMERLRDELATGLVHKVPSATRSKV